MDMRRRGFKAGVKLLFALIILGAFTIGMSGAALAADNQDIPLLLQAFQVSGENSVSHVKLIWSGVDGECTIARKEKGKDDYKEIGRTSSVSYDDSGLEEGKTYTYKVENSGKTGTAEVTIPEAKNGSSTYDNTKSSSLKSVKASIKKSGLYYQYEVSSEGGTVTINEKTSKDGFDFKEGRQVYKGFEKCKLESVNIKQNPSGKVVIWAHYENDSDYTEAKTVCFAGEPGDEEFKLVKEPFRPQDKESRDITLFTKDNDAYLISSTNGNADMNVYKLNDEWTDVLSEQDYPAICIYQEGWREAPCMVYKDGWYYLFTSGTNGWYPTQGEYKAAQSVEGLADAESHEVGNSSTFGTQSGGITQIGDTYVMMANRWSGGWKYHDPALTDGAWSSQKMLPLMLSEGNAGYTYYPQVKYDIENGTVIPVQAGENLSQGKKVVADETLTTPGTEGNGPEKGNNGIGTSADLYKPADATAYKWTVDLGKMSIIKEIDITFNRVNGSDAYNQYVLRASTDGDNFVTIKDCSSNKLVGFVENKITNTNKFRYVQLEVTGIKNLRQDNDPDAGWENGFHELTVYGTQTTESYDGGSYNGVPVGEEWYDTDGNSIQAHGGGFLQEGDTYYWVGENKSHGSANFKSVSLYSSKDLLNWKNEGEILTLDSETASGAENGLTDCKVERPKLVKNPDGTYILWGHWEDATGYTSSQIMVATSTSIAGPYTFQGHWRPGAKKDDGFRNWRAVDTGSGIQYITDAAYAAGKAADLSEDTIADTESYGFGSRDLTIYAEGSTAYLISAEDHEKMRIHELNSTFDDVKQDGLSYNFFYEGHREAPALVKDGSVYYLITSGQSGWYPNQAKYAYTTDITDPEGWSELKMIGNSSTFYSQPTNIMTIQGNKGNSYVYMGDRWNSKALGASTYVWLPLTIDSASHTMDMIYAPGWKLDVESGSIIFPDTELVSEKKPVIAEEGAMAQPEGGEPFELKPEYANDGNCDMDSFWNTSDNYYYGQNKVPYTWTVDLEKVCDLARIDTSFVACNGSESYYAYTLKGSNDNENWTVLSDKSSNKQVAFTSDSVSGKYRYVQIEVSKVINDHNGNSTADWANGLIEVQVYANKLEKDLAELPKISVKSGTYTETQNVELSAGEDAKIYYTTDGSEPNDESKLYKEPIEIKKGDTTLKAVSYEKGKLPSGVAACVYHVIDPNDITGIQEDQTLNFALFPDEGVAGLPETLKAITAEGNNKDDAAVEWKTEGMDFSQPYTEQSVTGTMSGGYQVKAKVSVIPENLKMFIDCGTKPAENATETSAFFEGIKNKLGNQLINNESDQKYDPASQWGYTGKVGDPNSDESAVYGIRNGSDFKASGWYGSDDRKMPYQIHLDAGTYTIISGHQEWWTATRNMTLEVAAGTQILTDSIHVDKENLEATGQVKLILDEASDVTISVYGDGAVLSWIAVEQLEDTMPDDVIGLAEGQTTNFAVTAEEGVQGLPATMEVLTQDGQQKSVPAEWELDEVSLEEVFTEQVINGTIGNGYKIQIRVSVIPEDLRMFIDCGTMPAENATSKSSFFEGVKNRLGDALLNQESDQRYDGDSQWGYSGIVGDPNEDESANYGIHTGDDFKANGWYGTEDREMPYQIHLDAGNYTITTGHQEWWEATRNMTLEVSYDGLEAPLTDSIHVDADNPEATGTVELAIDTPKDINISVYGDGAVLSWIAVREEGTVAPEPALESIAILKNPTKTEYVVGEEFSSEGLELLAKYSDKTTKIITRDYEVSPVDMSTAGQKTVTVSYGGQTASFTVDVKEDPDKEDDTEKEQTLEDKDSGICVSGRISNGAKLNVVKKAEGDYPELSKVLDGKQITGVYEISLDGTFEGELTVKFPVDTQYNGKTVYMAHMKQSGEIEMLSGTVADGFAEVKITELSPFMLAVDKTDEPNDNPDNNPGNRPDNNKPDNSNPDNNKPDKNLSGNSEQNEGNTTVPKDGQTGGGSTVKPIKTGDTVATEGWIIVLAISMLTGAIVIAIQKKRQSRL